MLSANSLINQGQPSSSSFSQPDRGWGRLLLREPNHFGSEKETNILNFCFQIKELCKVNALYLISISLGIKILQVQKNSHLKCKSLGERGKERVLFKLVVLEPWVVAAEELSQLLLSLTFRCLSNWPT